MSANPLKGEVAFDLPVVADPETGAVIKPARRLILVYTIDRLAALEDELDMETSAITRQLTVGARLNFLKTTLLAGLLEHQPQSELSDASEILSRVPGREIGLKLITAMARAFPDPKPEEGDGARPQKAARGGTGKRSSSSGAS